VLARQAADYLEHKQTERTQKLAADEFNRGVKNTFANVEATASMPCAVPRPRLNLRQVLPDADSRWRVFTPC